MSITRRCSQFAVAAFAFASLAHAASAQDFYRGKQLNFILASDVGGSYDTFARMIGRHLPKYIPGSPLVVVQNMPGAGGMRAANWLYNVAPKDGLTIGLLQNTTPFEPLYGNKQGQFEAAKFNWLGSPSQETGIFMLWHTSPVNSLEDMKTREVILGAAGTGSTAAFFSRVFAEIFDLKIKLITGYKSQSESFLAMERGENDGYGSPFWSSMTSDFPEWIKEKKIKVLAYYGQSRDPEIPGPYVFDLIKSDQHKAIMELAQAGLVMGRPIAMPPDVPADKVEIMQKALAGVFKDEAFLGECKKARLDCSQPLTGKELSDHVNKIRASPPAAIETITKIYQEGQKG